MSFRPKGEILLRSLAFAPDDRPCPSLGVLCALARVNSPIRVFQLNEKFAQAAEILKDSSTEFAELGVFLLSQDVPLASTSQLSYYLAPVSLTREEFATSEERRQEGRVNQNVAGARYGFTDKELDFIPWTALRVGILSGRLRAGRSTGVRTGNYDIKYRMGRDAETTGDSLTD